MCCKIKKKPLLISNPEILGTYYISSIKIFKIKSIIKRKELNNNKLRLWIDINRCVNFYTTNFQIASKRLPFEDNVPSCFYGTHVVCLCR